MVCGIRLRVCAWISSIHLKLQFSILAVIKCVSVCAPVLEQGIQSNQSRGIHTFITVKPRLADEVCAIPMTTHTHKLALQYDVQVTNNTHVMENTREEHFIVHLLPLSC